MLPSVIMQPRWVDLVTVLLLQVVLSDVRLYDVFNFCVVFLLYKFICVHT